MDVDIEKEVETSKLIIRPCTALVLEGASLQLFPIAEQHLFQAVKKPESVFLTLIAIYYCFNMAYPKPLYPTLIDLQQC